MPVPGFAHGVTSQSYWMTHLGNAQTKTAAKTDTTQTASAATAKTADSGSSFWDDVLDVVNPLQHLPVVGTVYRAITGDKIGDVEKVAGDTLYGGPIGLVSSLADVAFEKITGKDFGSTVMAFVGLDHSDDTTALAADTSKPDAKSPAAAPVKVADASIAGAAPTPISRLATLPSMTIPVQAATPSTPHSSPPPASAPVDISNDTDALLSALARNGVTGQMQTQALDAYRRTMSMNAAPVSAAVH
ncbi:MAG TPA: hypothetical protein VLT91_03080 [Rhizomicrobium sp.]|nr:hypothetical protein [Rhizomicrobium sp.]